VLNFLLQLVLALMIALAVFSAFRGCFRLTPEGERSYAEFAALVQEIAAQEDDVLESKSMVFDRETTIFGFTKDAGRVQSRIFANEKYLLRPAACSPGTACLCLCQELSARTIAKDFRPDEITNEIICPERLSCQDVLGADFPPSLSKAQVGYPPDESSDAVAVEGGFIFGRNDYLSLPVEQRRIRPLYIQKAGAYLSICAAPDCISGELIASSS